MKKADQDYYRERLTVEREAAHRAVHPVAAESHRKLADEYATLLTAEEADDQI